MDTISSLKRFTRKSINSILNVAGYELTRQYGYFSDYKDYIPLKDTISNAKKAGLSVGDYIDLTHNVPGATQVTIDKMRELGVFETKIERVCEIGPGSGRYMEKTLQIVSPTYYEIYETSQEWQDWLVKEYDVVPQPTDGRSLAATPDKSIDLVHTHKVLPGQSSLVILNYLKEMGRVVKPNGKVVFDIVTEECMDEATLEKWFEGGGGYQSYPCLMAKQYAIDFLINQGLSFDGSFVVEMKPGVTQYLIFTKR